MIVSPPPTSAKTSAVAQRRDLRIFFLKVVFGISEIRKVSHTFNLKHFKYQHRFNDFAWKTETHKYKLLSLFLLCSPISKFMCLGFK